MGIVEWSEEAEGPPETVVNAVLSSEGLRRWFLGVNRIEADTDWPAQGTRMRWWVGRRFPWKFEAHVTEDARPLYIVTEVVTPSADSRITHRFDPLPNGRTRYTKRVEPTYRGVANRLLGPVLAVFLRRWVRAEVRRAVGLVKAP